jgi:hypothetical protein
MKLYYHPKGPWRVVHELNQCGTADSDIYDEGLGSARRLAECEGERLWSRIAVPERRIVVGARQRAVVGVAATAQARLEPKLVGEIPRRVLVES